LKNNLGNVYRDLGSYQKAVDAYQKAIRLNEVG
jgi:cytochrome c-type biogenesis protein CcmH/NrfG